MNIYFAGSIRGNPEWTHLYPIIIEELKKQGTVLTEFFQWTHNTKEVNQYVSDQAIFEDDIKNLDKSDIIVAEVSGPSHGCGWEICYAQYVRKIPIICIYMDSANPSAMLRGNDYLQLYPYNKDNILEVLQTAFQK